MVNQKMLLIVTATITTDVHIVQSSPPQTHMIVRRNREKKRPLFSLSSLAAQISANEYEFILERTHRASIFYRQNESEFIR